MYEKEFNKFGSIIQVDNFHEACLHDYDDYLDTVIEFKGTKEDIGIIFEKYKDSICRMILSGEKLKDRIMSEEEFLVRHDKEFEKTVDISKITDDIFNRKDNLNYFEERARIVTLLEVANLINYYGMEELEANQEKIEKEIRLGIFEAKIDRYLPKDKLEKIMKRINIDEVYGEDAIQYIENFELLKERVQFLRDFTKVPEEIQQLDYLIQQLTTVDSMKVHEDTGMPDLLIQCYSDYEQMNRKMILSRLNSDDRSVIDDPKDESLLLLHFIPEINIDDNNNESDKSFNKSFDVSQNEFFHKVAAESIRVDIKNKYHREYDPKIDSEEANAMMKSFIDSRKKPYDLKLRIPLKNRYTNRSFQNVITAPQTNLSCSIARVGALHPHLDRKIAIGFSRAPISAIKTINRGYNGELDRFSFERNSVSLPEVLEHIDKGGTNETLVDWTQVEPAYIMLVKDTERIPIVLLMKAKEYSNMSGLPLKIYDAYEIENRKNNSVVNDQNQEIEGAYSISDLAMFTQTKSQGDLIRRCKEIIASKEIGDTQNENNR